MNLVTAVKQYVIKMTEESGLGMKVLLMDKETTSIVSMVFSQSEILQREVYLFERLDMATDNETMKHLRCIVFLRPTKENIQLLSRELKNPRYGVYYIYMSNIIAKADIKTLAENDDQEVAKELVEYYADFLANSPHLFSLNIPVCAISRSPDVLTRCVQGISAVLLSLKKYPSIRYDGLSEDAKYLAEKVHNLVTKEDTLFDFRNDGSQTVLLILDRKQDPFTPLLTQWTYEAMVHELFTINNNRVDLRHIDGVSKELQEVILSPLHDEFYAENMFQNYGVIGQQIRNKIDEYHVLSKDQHKLESIKDMKNFIDNYPQFKKMTGTVSKHVTIVGELSNLVSKKCLLELSEIEQEVTCQNQHSEHLQKIRNILSKNQLDPLHAAKLVMLYALKYEKNPNNDVNGLIKKLTNDCKLPQYWIQMIHKVIEYGKKNSLPLENTGTQETVKQVTKRLFKDLKGVENVYTQHIPPLKETLIELMKGNLKDNYYPYIPYNTANRPYRPNNIIVFMIGGITYEESLAVHQLNCLNSNSNVKIVVGGSTIHNSTSFLNEVDALKNNISTPTHNSSRSHSSYRT